MSSWRYLWAGLLCGCVLSGLGAPPGPTKTLVLTQTPHGTNARSAEDRLDLHYPPGSRVVVATSPWTSPKILVLSEGLYAAGSPVVTYDGERVYFVGKTGAEGDWQIYEAPIGGGRRRPATSLPGGAAGPALLPDGGLVFASPAPKLSKAGATVSRPQLYAQSAGGQPRRLTFGLTGAAEPTVLPDGRILFVSAVTPGATDPWRGLSLFTVNNDGTEVTAFACQHDPPAVISRPRLLPDGRLAFLVSGRDSAPTQSSAEFVRMARPFLSRGKLIPGFGGSVRSVSSDVEGGLLVCAENSHCSGAVYRVDRTGDKLGMPLFEEANWDCVEAVVAAPSQRPMGRLSTTDSGKKTGQVLCLNANDTTYGAETEAGAKASRIRVVTELSPGRSRSLGEVPVQDDGSFMAEVPADMPLGFEALNQEGKVLRRVEPIVWVRPGENRSCIGCHAPHNRSPHNHRPLAVYAGVPCLSGEPELSRAQKVP